MPALPSRSQNPQPLSTAEVGSFRKEGFLVVPAVCDAAEVDRIRALLRGLFLKQTGRDEGNQLDMLSADHTGAGPVQPQIVKPSLYAPELLHTDHFRSVQALARQLLGADAQFLFDHCILKPAGRVAATPWHQDEAHNDDPHFTHEQISFWMPLQDVSEENGCMRYLPGSHRGPLLPHRSPGDDPRIHALECLPGSFDESAAVSRPAAAGACILHAGRTLHAALPNRAGADRLAYVVVFRAQPVPRSESGQFAWLAAKRTASLERGSRWRSRGGYFVLLTRWLRRTLSSDLRGLRFKLGRQLRRWQVDLRERGAL